MSAEYYRSRSHENLETIGRGRGEETYRQIEPMEAARERRERSCHCLYVRAGHPFNKKEKNVRRSMMYKNEIGGEILSRADFIQVTVTLPCCMFLSFRALFHRQLIRDSRMMKYASFVVADLGSDGQHGGSEAAFDWQRGW